jgi:ligand-binding SRPBCC domain-containing protein
LVERGGEALTWTKVTVAVDVDATPEEVWSFLSDPGNLPRWSRLISKVEGVPPDGLALGARYTVVMKLAAVRARVAAEVLEWDPPGRSVVQLTGLLDAKVTTTVSPLPGDRSELAHEVEYRFRGGHLGDLAARGLRLFGGAQFALRHGALAQKRQIEGR